MLIQTTQPDVSKKTYADAVKSEEKRCISPVSYPSTTTTSSSDLSGRMADLTTDSDSGGAKRAVRQLQNLTRDDDGCERYWYMANRAYNRVEKHEKRKAEERMREFEMRHRMQFELEAQGLKDRVAGLEERLSSLQYFHIFLCNDYMRRNGLDTPLPPQPCIENANVELGCEKEDEEEEKEEDKGRSEKKKKKRKGGKRGE